MKLSWEHGSNDPARHIEVIAPTETSLADRGVLCAVGSRSDAARLASVLHSLEALGVPQATAVLASPGRATSVYDDDFVPQTEQLVGPVLDSGVAHTAHALAAAEQILLELRPRLMLLSGDSNATLAFALAASKLGIEIARVGAGLRSGDFSQSEEINRLLGDRLGDALFVDSHEAVDALRAEGIQADRIFHVGNTAIDLLRRCEDDARRAAAWRRLGLPPGEYVLATLHRAENVADAGRIEALVDALAGLARRLPVVMPLHPATRALMEPHGMVARLEAMGARVTGPLGYLDFLSLQQTAGAILTDSGGVQDEASALGVRCYTLRRATERVVTLTHGTNVLLGDDPAEIAHVEVGERPITSAAVPLWDGHAGDRIASELSGRFTLELVS